MWPRPARQRRGVGVEPRQTEGTTPRVHGPRAARTAATAAARSRSTISAETRATAIPEAAQLPVSLGVIELAPEVGAAIDLDDEPDVGREEVDDEGVEDDLPTKPNAELATAQRLPETRLRECRMHAHVASPRREASDGDVIEAAREATTHGDLRAPRGWARRLRPRPATLP